jgi:hypothetical protein
VDNYQQECKPLIEEEKDQDGHYRERLTDYWHNGAGAATLNLALSVTVKLERAVTRGKFHWLRAFAVSRLVFSIVKGESLDLHEKNLVFVPASGRGWGVRSVTAVRLKR